MIIKSELNKTESFSIPIPAMAAWKNPNTNHQITIVCSGDCNDGFMVNARVKPANAPGDEPVEDGSVNAYENAGGQKTLIITSGGKGLLIDEIAVVITGRTAGSVSAYYTGYGDNDPGEDFTERAD